MTSGEYSGRPEPHRGTTILALALLGLLACAPFGIPAWVMGGSDLSSMREGRMDRSGESLTTAGYVIGIVATGIFCIQIVAVCLWIGAAGAVMNAPRFR